MQICDKLWHSYRRQLKRVLIWFWTTKQSNSSFAIYFTFAFHLHCVCVNGVFFRLFVPEQSHGIVLSCCFSLNLQFDLVHFFNSPEKNRQQTNDEREHDRNMQMQLKSSVILLFFRLSNVSFALDGTTTNDETVYLCCCCCFFSSIPISFYFFSYSKVEITFQGNVHFKQI